MRTKTIKKIVAMFSVIAVSFSMTGFSVAIAQTSPDATTSLTRGSGGGTAPIIKAKWEMDDWHGTDSSSDPGAQLPAPGVWGGKLIYKVCAIATDPNGVSDLDLGGVYADIYYPVGKAIHDLVPSADVHRDTSGGTKDIGQGGCGAFIEQNKLIKQDKTVGYELFCNKIKNNNTNLPTFFTGYDYNEICAPDGELMKEEAFVYCDVKTLTWEDPAGLYTVKIKAQDKAGNDSNILVNNFEYLPLTAFEKDFKNVNYGEVMLSSDKKIPGDLTFGTAALPTIRNLGNTRLYMHIAQDDMGLGQSSGLWNVEFDARVGSHIADWTVYNPFGYKPALPSWPSDYTMLEDILDLSETEEMDFSIHVKKWPDDSTVYSGNMYLAATSAPFRICKL